jgi:hypothetical protein
MISKKEYEKLLDAKMRFEYLRAALENDIFASPPLRSRKKVISEMKKIGAYSPAFLKSMERGLKRSAHFSA